MYSRKVSTQGICKLTEIRKFATAFLGENMVARLRGIGLDKLSVVYSTAYHILGLGENQVCYTLLQTIYSGFGTGVFICGLRPHEILGKAQQYVFL